ncbi:MAG: CBS domain-containing protein [Thermodesulfobacteriales bacterium]|jgi:CBS domain-containing protein|nr:MAG: CBS domain-containing protein [Thermodesulfobacteriales bacterium]
MKKPLIRSTKPLKDILNRDVITIGPTASVSEAAYLMMREEIGSLVVVDDERFPVGIITDRDLVISVIAGGKNSEEVIVEEVMTKDLVYIDESANIMDILSTLSEYSIRRMPVTKDGKLTGIVSVDDLIVVIATELSDLAIALSSKSKVL